jgi:RNA polymerase primary sigma factor
MDDLKDIPEVSLPEELELIRQAYDGNTRAKDKLIEINLMRVIGIVNKYTGKSIPTSDLIQEGNLGLIEGVATFNDDISIVAFNAHIDKCIEHAIQSVIDEEIDAGRISKHLADRANALDRFSTEFAKENGREATLEELAFGMGLPEEEIRNILKYSLDALNSTGEE